MKALKLLMTLGSAMAAAKAAKSFTNVGMDDLLDYAGLERHRSHVWEKIAFFGMGALAGAGAGILLAPASGRETREKLGQNFDRLATKASEAIAEVKEQAPELIGKVTGHTPSSQSYTGTRVGNGTR